QDMLHQRARHALAACRFQYRQARQVFALWISNILNSRAVAAERFLKRRSLLPGQSPENCDRSSGLSVFQLGRIDDRQNSKKRFAVEITIGFIDLGSGNVDLLGQQQQKRLAVKRNLFVKLGKRLKDQQAELQEPCPVEAVYVFSR